jgi:hypothetical protein
VIKETVEQGLIVDERGTAADMIAAARSILYVPDNVGKSPLTVSLPRNAPAGVKGSLSRTGAVPSPVTRFLTISVLWGSELKQT